MKFLILVSALILSGCAAKVKRQILGDIKLIADQAQDCPTLCEKLKAYIQSQI